MLFYLFCFDFIWWHLKLFHHTIKRANSFILAPLVMMEQPNSCEKPPLEVQPDSGRCEFSICGNRSALTRLLLLSSVCQPVFQLISERLFTQKKKEKRKSSERRKGQTSPNHPPHTLVSCVTTLLLLPSASLYPLTPTHHPSPLPPLYSLLSKGGCQIALAFSTAT